MQYQYNILVSRYLLPSLPQIPTWSTSLPTPMKTCQAPPTSCAAAQRQQQRQARPRGRPWLPSRGSGRGLASCGASVALGQQSLPGQQRVAAWGAVPVAAWLGSSLWLPSSAQRCGCRDSAYWRG